MAAVLACGEGAVLGHGAAAALWGLLRPIDGLVESDRSRSDLETYFLRLCRRRRLPPPEVNVKVGRWEVDDHGRDLDLRAAGFTVLRFTELQLEEEPERVVADVARALGRGGIALGGS